MTKEEFLMEFLLVAMRNSEYWNAAHILQCGEKAWEYIYTEST